MIKIHVDVRRSFDLIRTMIHVFHVCILFDINSDYTSSIGDKFYSGFAQTTLGFAISDA